MAYSFPLAADIVKELEDTFGRTAASPFIAAMSSVQDFIGHLTQQIGNASTAVYDSVRTFVDTVEGTVFDKITGAVSGVEHAVQGIGGQIQSGISSLAGTLGGVFNNAIARVEQAVQSEAQTIEKITGGLITAVDTAIGSMGKAIGDAVTKAVSSVEDVATKTYNALVDGAKTVGKFIYDGVHWLYDGINNTLGGIEDTIIKTGEQWFNWIIDAGRKFGLSIDHFLDQAWTEIQQIGQGIQIGAEELKDWVTNVAYPAVTKWLEHEGAAIAKLYDELQLMVWVPLMDNPLMPSFIKDIGAQDSFTAQVLATLLDVGAMASIIPQLLISAYAGEVALIQQGAMGESQAGLMSPGDVVEAMIRGAVSEGYVDTQLFRQGLNGEAKAAITANYEKFLSPGDAIALYFQEHKSKDALYREFGAQGYPRSRVDEMITAAEYLPPVPDTIRFLVREVFTPDIANKFGQFEDYPELFDKLASHLGLSSEWAKAYWAAHWELPSATQGFEMFHRGIISYDDLQMLLRALDVMPFWRDKLIQTNYDNLTRVDIRRMFELDVLTVKEVYEAYQHLGYSPVDAQRLTTFTEKLKSEAAGSGASKRRERTKQEIDKAYTESMINRVQAVDMYKAIGFSPDETEFELALVEWDLALKRRNQQVKRLKVEFEAGVLDHPHFWEQLSLLGLHSDEMNAIDTDIWFEHLPKPQYPSLAHWEKWYHQGIVKDDDMRVALAQLGYNDAHAELFMRSLGTPTAGKGRKQAGNSQPQASN